jgi:hypothetical protein
MEEGRAAREEMLAVALFMAESGLYGKYRP